MMATDTDRENPFRAPQVRDTMPYGVVGLLDHLSPVVRVCGWYSLISVSVMLTVYFFAFLLSGNHISLSSGLGWLLQLLMVVCAVSSAILSFASFKKRVRLIISSSLTCLVAFGIAIFLLARG